MNILIAADYRAPQSGNFIASLIALARVIREQGNNVLFVFPQKRDWSEWFKREGLKVIWLNEFQSTFDNECDFLNLIIEENNIDLIHTHFGLFHHTVVYDKKALGNVKIIMHDHMDYSVNASVIKQFIRIAMKSFVYRSRDIRIITVMKRKKLAYLFVKKKWYIPNGLSLERNIEKSMTREECREELGIKENEKMVFMLGWDMKLKGVDITLKAVQECRKKNSNIIFGIIGLGNSPSEDARDFVKKEAGIDCNEKWIRFFESYEDMFALHRAIDVYVSSSRKDAFSYGLLEAISQNTPVVVSDIPGTRWAKKYSKSFIYPTENIEACADSIMKAIEVGRKESNSNELVEKYGVEKWAKKITESYMK